MVAGCIDSKAEIAPAEPLAGDVRLVEIARVESEPLTRTHRFSGVLRAADRADLTFTLSGRVVKRPAQIGATVAKNQVLAVLDRRPLRNALTASRARQTTLASQLAQSERDTSRAQRLRAAEAIGAEELERTVSGKDMIAAQMAAANADVAEARRLLGEATLRAPFAGTVIDVLIEPGEFAHAGRPAILLSGEGRAEVEIEVPNNLQSSLLVGDLAEIRFPLTDDEPITATIKHVGRASAGAGRLVPVVVVLPEAAEQGNTMPGQTAEVVLTSKTKAALTVPVAAVVDPSGARPALFRVTDQIAILTRVELGRVHAGRVQVRKGIASGDSVVVRGHANLVSGETVRAKAPADAEAKQ